MVENVLVCATDELDHGFSRECRGASVQTGIVPSDSSVTHVLGWCPLLIPLTGNVCFEPPCRS